MMATPEAARPVTRAVPALRALMLAAGVALLGTPLASAAQVTPAPDFLVTVPSAQGFDETVSLLREAIASENLMVVEEVNPQQMLRLVGMRTDGMLQILFFHPRYMKRIIETNRNGGIEAPLKILIMERPDGSAVVRYHDPVHLFAPYAGLEELSAEFDAMFERITASVR